MHLLFTSDLEGFALKALYCLLYFAQPYICGVMNTIRLDGVTRNKFTQKNDQTKVLYHGMTVEVIRIVEKVETHGPRAGTQRFRIYLFSIIYISDWKIRKSYIDHMT